MAEQAARIEDGDGNIVVQAVDSTVTISGTASPKLTLIPWHLRPRPVKSDVGLLDPFTAAIPFVGRQPELQRLQDWLSDTARVSVRCLTGRAGTGKTRLAIELCRCAEALDSWDPGFATHTELARFFAHQNLAAWGWRRPTLVVIDYAAGAARALRQWLEELALNLGRNGAPLRLLLLERFADTGTGWWADLTRVSFSEAGLLDLFDPPEPEPLPVLSVDDRAALRRAVTVAASPQAAGPSEQAIIRADVFSRRTEDGEALDELMWGLIAERDLALVHGTAPVARIRLAEALADRERRRLDRLADDQQLDRKALAHMAAVLTLQGGADPDGAQAAIEQEREALGFATAARPLRMILIEALPAANGGRIGGVVPDLIGEAFIIAALTRGGLTDREQAEVLARCRSRAPTATLASVMRTAQDFAQRDQHPSLRWLDALIERCETLEEMRQIDASFPHQTVILRERAAKVTAFLVQLLSSTAEEADEEPAKAERARLLNNASVRLSALGRREEALTAAEEAVAIRRALAEQRPDAFRPDLASSLNNYANFLSALGRREEALTAAEEAVAVYRALAEQRPDAFRPNLAMSLAVLANCLEGLKGPVAALAHDCDSVALLTLSFQRWPKRYAGLMSAVCRDYLRRCKAADVEPDESLLGPVVAVFQRLQPVENAVQAEEEE